MNIDLTNPYNSDETDQKSKPLKYDFSRIEVYFESDLLDLLREFGNAQMQCRLITEILVEDDPIKQVSSETLRKMPSIRAALEKKNRLPEGLLGAPQSSAESTDVY